MGKELSLIEADMSRVYRDIKGHPNWLQAVKKERIKPIKLPRGHKNLSDYTGARR